MAVLPTASMLILSDSEATSSGYRSMDVSAQILDFVALAETAASVVFRVLRLADYADGVANGSAFTIGDADNLALLTVAPRVLMHTQRLLLRSNADGLEASRGTPLSALSIAERTAVERFALIAHEVMLQAQGNASAVRLRNAVRQRFPDVNSTMWIGLAVESAITLTGASVRVIDEFALEAAAAHEKANRELALAALYVVALIGQLVAGVAVLQSECRRRRIAQQDDELTAKSSFIRFIAHECRK